MSLLDKATIITTPTAHSNGVLHSIKGGSVADFDVVRGSLATRVNAEGLIEDISTLSGELVTNGGFDTDLSGWLVTDGAAGIDITWTANGVSFITDGAGGGIQQTALTIGKSYLIEFDYTAVSGAIKMSPYFADINETKRYSKYIVATTTAISFYRKEANTEGIIDNVSVKEVIDATNIPRIDYTTGEGVVLLEPQSTNLCINSEPTVDEGAQSGISYETYSINRFTNCIRYGDNSVDRYRYGGNTTAGVINTHSCFVLMDDGSEPNIGISASDDFAILINGANATTILPPVNYGDGLWRVFGSKQSFVSNSNNGIYKFSTQSAKGFRVFGLQTEALPYATSYIPTSGAIATRLADSVTGAGSTDLINSEEGVLYAEIAAFANDGTYKEISLSDGTSSNRIEIRYIFNDISFTARIGGVSEVDGSFTPPSVFNLNKIALRYNGTDFKLYVNGSLVDTDTSINTFPANTFTSVQFNSGAGASIFYGKVKSLITFNTALTDAELECLTTI